MENTSRKMGRLRSTLLMKKISDLGLIWVRGGEKRSFCSRRREEEDASSVWMGWAAPEPARAGFLLSRGKRQGPWRLTLCHVGRSNWLTREVGQCQTPGSAASSVQAERRECWRLGLGQIRKKFQKRVKSC